MTSPLPDPPRSTLLPPLPVPPLLAGQPPIAILADYDGTIARTDVSDTLLSPFIDGDWDANRVAYDPAVIGSRRRLTWEVSLLRGDPSGLGAEAAAQPHDPDFPAFAERARAAGIPVEVVSDGYGFFIPAALSSMGVGWVPVVTATTTFAAGRARIEFPNGDPRCFVCGTCKRNRVLAHQAAGRRVAFIGDGVSDRYAAGYADVVFAKDSLVEHCRERGWPFTEWTSFAEVRVWLDAQLTAFAADPLSLPGPERRAPFCGAEVWGPDRFDPVAPEVGG